MIPFPDKKYQVIYADPAWRYIDTSTNGAAEDHYPTMATKDICALPIPAISEDNAVLFLWATYPLMPEALQVISSWGFKYKTAAFVWIKKTDGGRYCQGTGFYSRANSEVCLLATKGNVLKIKDHNVNQIVETTRSIHSRKPNEVRERIERLFGNTSRIELFARQRIEGWDCWGDQIPDSKQAKLYPGII